MHKFAYPIRPLFLATRQVKIERLHASPTSLRPFDIRYQQTEMSQKIAVIGLFPF
jgi:hypothetical protein